MKKYFIITIAITSMLFYACNGNMESSQYDLASNIAAEVKTEGYEEVTETEASEDDLEGRKDIAIPARSIKKIERKLIKEGSITFETADAKATKKMIHQVSNSLNGYLARDNEASYGNRIQHNITIRIPSDKFDNLLVDISSSIKEIEDQNISVRDVTDEYVDISARLKAKKIVEKRYLELLSKAHSVGDVLQVESELARLREEIESTEGRLRYLKDQVSLSTLHISFYETIEINEPSFEFLSKVGDGFSNGFKGLLWFFIGLVNVWPFLLFIGLLTWLVVRLIKRSTKKKS